METVGNWDQIPIGRLNPGEAVMVGDQIGRVGRATSGTIPVNIGDGKKIDLAPEETVIALRRESS